MIAKISKGSSFGGAVKYVLDETGRDDKIVEVLACEGLSLDLDDFSAPSSDHAPDPDAKQDNAKDLDPSPDHGNEPSQDQEHGKDQNPEHDPEHDPEHGKEVKPGPPLSAILASDFQLQADMNPRVSVPVRDFILSYSPADLPKLSNASMLRDAKAYLKGMGYGNTQYLVVRHMEKDNPHVHIIANAVDFDGKKIPDKYDRARSTKICKEITLSNEYTWGNHKSMSEAKDIHNPIDRVKYDLSQKIVDAIGKSDSIHDFPDKMAEMGVGCHIRTDAKGEPVGISFSVQAEDKKGEMREYKFAGSHIDRNFAVRNIAVACELHRDMPDLVRCAYTLKDDCEAYPKHLLEGARLEYENLNSVLRQAYRQRKQLEYQFKGERKRVAVVAFMSLMLGPAISVVIPAAYIAMRQFQYEHEYARASRSIATTLKQVKAAKQVMRTILTKDITHRYPPYPRAEDYRRPVQPSLTRSRGMRR